MSVEEAPSDGMSRRTLMRSTAAAGGLALGLGGASELGAFGNARACPPCAVAGGIAIGAAGVGLYSHYAGDDNDTEAVLGAIEFEDHLESYNRFREWWEVENQVQLASFENDLNNLHNQLLNNGIRTLYEQALEGSDEASAISTAKADMDDNADELAEWIVSWWNARLGSSAVSKGVDLGVLQMRDQEGTNQASPDYQNAEMQEGAYTLPGRGGDVPVSGVQAASDGSRITLAAPDGSVADFDGTHTVADVERDFWSLLWIKEPNPDNYSFDTEEYDGPEDFDDWEHVDGDQRGIDATKYGSLLETIETKLETAKSDLDSVASDHFTAIQEGDVTLDELMAPGGLLETAGDAETAHGAALFFRAQNMPHTDGVKVRMDHPTEDRELEMEGYLGWSIADDGDQLPIGTLIDPESYLGSIYFATQYEDEDGNMTGDVIELLDSFEIVSSNEEGDSVTFESPDSLPDADTDPDEVIRIFDENRDSEQDARDQTIEVVIEETSNDGGDLLGGLPDIGGGSTLGKIAAALGGGLVTIAVAAGLGWFVARD